MCKNSRLKLLPAVMIAAALLSVLIIFSNTSEGLFIVFAAALGMAFLVLAATGLLSAVCGLQRSLGEPCHSRTSVTCLVIRYFGPTVLCTAAVSVLFALPVLEGAFAVFPPLLNSILGVLYALVFSTMLVFFTGMFAAIIKKLD